MSAKTDQKQRTHGAILESAARLLRERGIPGATVGDVMHGAGLTVGGFYAHFASKQALVDDTIRHAGTESRTRLFEGLGPASADRAVQVVRRYLSRTHRDDPGGGCPMPAVVGGVVTSAPEHGAALAEQVEALAAELGASALPDDGPTVRQAALAVAALMYGGLSLARATRGTPLSDEVLAACRAVGKSLVGAGRQRAVPGHWR